MSEHRTGTREEWLAARRQLLAREKELTRRSDELARERLALPWVRVDKEYEFDTPEGTKTLAELFGGRSQLIVYHFMHGPLTPEGCVGCTFMADHFDGAVAHLAQHDVTFLCASRSPLPELEAYKERMGWSVPWVSSEGSDFNDDFYEYADEEGRPRVGANFSQPVPGRRMLDVMELMALSTFALEDGVVYHVYTCMDRGTDVLNGTWQLLDRTPKGRDAAPEGWLRRHDEYEAA